MRKIKLAALSIGALVLAGCGNGAVETSQNQSGSQSPSSEKISVSEEKNGERLNDAGGNEGVISSIKDAMGLGKTMKCTYRIKSEDGEMEAISYVDGKKYKTEMIMAGVATNMVFDENTMYTWSKGQKQGTKMAIDCMGDLKNSMPEAVPETDSLIADPTGEKMFEDALDVKCEEVSGADFSLPSDVVFSDQCEMMKKMLKNLPAGMPNGSVLPKGDIPVSVGGTPEEPTL